MAMQRAWADNETECWRPREQLCSGEILLSRQMDAIAEGWECTRFSWLQVSRDGTSDEEKELRERLTGPDPDLTDQERLMIREYLEQYADAAER
jgi:hypothetical protein